MHALLQDHLEQLLIRNVPTPHFSEMDSLTLSNCHATGLEVQGCDITMSESRSS